MVVGVCRVVLALPYNDSLKGKRAVVRKVIERARSRFQVAAAEVDDLDRHRQATLGFSLVSNDARHVRAVLDKVVGFAAGASEAQLVARDVDVFQHDFPEAALPDIEGSDDWHPPEWDEDEED